jgi:hypothetical protein
VRELGTAAEIPAAGSFQIFPRRRTTAATKQIRVTDMAGHRNGHGFAGAKSHDVVAVGARRFHQGKKLIHRRRRNLPYALDVERSSDPHLPDDGMDFIAKVTEECQRILGIVRHARNEAGDEYLAGDHAAV